MSPGIVNEHDICVRNAKCTKIKSKLLKAAYNYIVTKLELDEDPLQCCFYFLNFMNSL